MILVTALSTCSLGWPITATRHYLHVPICNKELLSWTREALGSEQVSFLCTPERQEEFRKAGLPCITTDNLEMVRKAVISSSLIVPGDIIPEERFTLEEKTALLTTSKGSEEQAEIEALLKRLGIEVPRLRCKALRVNYPWEVLDANQVFADKLGEGIDPSASVEKGAVLKGIVRLGQRSVVRAGAYIEGPVVIGAGCEIGPMAHLRPHTSIGDNCIIGKTEIVDTVILPNSVSKHHAYIGHSVLGTDVNIGAFTVTADYRHDGKENVTLVRGNKITSGRRKLGAFIGDRARIAVATVFYPGRKLGPAGTTLPGEVIKEDRN